MTDPRDDLPTRGFSDCSVLGDSGLSLALAPALTPTGIALRPSFFHGFATQPLVLARAMLTLADITATRYYNFVPTDLRDPVLTAAGDRLRAECFSACNGVYGRFDLLAAGLDGGEIARGTTNVDVSPGLRTALTGLTNNELLHLNVGDQGLAACTPDVTVYERPVAMPDRWVRALGNAGESVRGLVPIIEVDAAKARTFVAALPPATGRSQAVYLQPGPSGVTTTPRPRGTAVFVGGLNRLAAVKRMLVHLTGMRIYGQPSPGPCVVEFGLPGGRLTLALTEEAWRGFSGEGALLPTLADPDVLDNADFIAAMLAFEPVIDVPALARGAALTPEQVRGALSVLAASGRVGWDSFEGEYFHRELPHDPRRVDKDNPRLVAARKLVDAGAVESLADGVHQVRSGQERYQVTIVAPADALDLTEGARCTCSWYINHGSGRGPCKHVLAVQLARTRRARER